MSYVKNPAPKQHLLTHLTGIAVEPWAPTLAQARAEANYRFARKVLRVYACIFIPLCMYLYIPPMIWHLRSFTWDRLQDMRDLIHKLEPQREPSSELSRPHDPERTA